MVFIPIILYCSGLF